ncbi:MAG TPA: endonuclease V [Candidatus Methanoperedens sp.]|nr:endonuclease V [Candidatus Methanoperedens sp.]HLB71440.1 endonuclease V [Candidatus Methanoperedens sp.]
MDDYFPSDRSRETLLAIQRYVAEKAIISDDSGEPGLIAGVDQAFLDDQIISGIVVLKYGSLEVEERAHSSLPVDFPYIPTFLSFREGAAIVSAYKKLMKKPDILMVDGVGINHPRQAGIATHIGVSLDVPTIGITKKILWGSGKEPALVSEASSLLYEGKKIGWLLKSSKRSRPIIIAPGHRVSLESSLSIVKACLRGHKLPEPARLAHEYASNLKKSMMFTP